MGKVHNFRKGVFPSRSTHSNAHWMSYDPVHNPALDSPGVEEKPGSSASREHTPLSDKKHRERYAHPRRSGSGSVTILRGLWLTTFLPVVAFAYLGFCYAAVTHVIPVGVYRNGNPEEHLYVIKAGVTTITIIIVAVSLLPLKSLLDDLKSEEFFRRLDGSVGGIPLKEVNDVSTPSHGMIEGIISSVRGTASGYYTGAIVAGLLAIAISTLAPAALSVGLVSIESDLLAIQVGAIPVDSVFKPSPIDSSTFVRSDVSKRAGEAAAMGWVQTVVGHNIPFLPTSSKYAVPAPKNIDPTSRARYLTDVIVMDPVCNWTIPSPPAVPAQTSGSSLQMNITLPDYGISTSYGSVSTWTTHNKTIEVIGGGSTFGSSLAQLVNITTQDPVTDGTMAWIVAQNVGGIKNERFSSSLDLSLLDLTGVPTQEVEISFNDTVAGTGNITSAKFSVLVCRPRARVETREVRLDGSGNIIVAERTGFGRQGNLHDGQTALLLTQSLNMYTTDSGPDSGYDGVGRAGQAHLFFGNYLWNVSATSSIKPVPIENITETYGLAQQAALNSYLSGKIATAYVPGRLQEVKLVFQSSLPQVIASTVLFGLVTLFSVVCYFRSYTESFTFFSIAATLARSNIPEAFERAREDFGEENAVQGVEKERIQLGSREGRLLQMN
ncbi:hypothetical protein AAF712_014825 [Marasmius tenuissimus]|uniref:Uncharacterized protein n=1 Tax=Marasmius tenuissimus TaxID=585030 RepID=A0ABR2Z9Z0_9AGAR